MKLKIEKPIKDGGIIDFDNGLVVNVNGVVYVAEYDFLPKDKTLYSLPSNDAHISWSPSRNLDISNIITNEHRIKLIKKWWSPFKKGDKVNGVISNNIFKIKR